MNKFFTLLIGASFCAGVATQAQTSIFKEDFESVTVPALPNGWSQDIKDTAGWKTDTNAISFSSGYVITAHTKYALLDDWNKNLDNSSSILVTPYLDLAGKSHTYMKFSYFFNEVAYTGGSPKESAFVVASIDSGKTWTVVTTLKGVQAWKEIYVNLSAYDNMSDILIGFKYNDGGDASKPLFGIGIDDVEIFTPPLRDVALNTINLPTLWDTAKAAVTGVPVKVSLMNYGSDTITSLDMEYTIDATTLITQNFTGLVIPPFTGTELSFSTGMPAVTSGQHDINMKAKLVNGAADSEPGNNDKFSNFITPSNSTTKAGLIEEFTSSTCPPCASFNTVFDPLIESNNVNTPAANFNTIKYQMNWPNPGNDASYNSHGNTRKSYYGVNSIPHHFTNGLDGGAGDQDEIDACKAGLAFVKIEGSYIITNDSGWADVTVTPYLSATRNLKVYIALTENDYWNEKNTTGQRHYIHAMRKMFPSGSGMSLPTITDNTPVNYKYATDFKVGDVKQGNFNLWSHPKNTNLVVFVQDDATGTVLQSLVIPSAWPTNIAETNSAIKELAVYPNPAADITMVGFNLNKAADVQVQVTDAVGRIVYTNSTKLSAGFNELQINTTAFNSGLYNIKVQAENTSIVKRLSVVK